MEKLNKDELSFLKEAGINKVENIKENENLILDFIMSKSRKEIQNNLNIFNNILNKLQINI